MPIGNDFLVFKYPVIYKQKISKILIIFIYINGNVSLLFDHHVMKGIILHTRRPNCQ